MSRIKGRDTSPEVELRRRVWQLGFRYRLNQRVAGVRPDFIFPKVKLAVFVDGCFWHGCPDHYVRPRSTNPEFWALKLSQNVLRDQRQSKHLEAEGWRVIRVWEHEVKRNPRETALLIRDVILGTHPPLAERWAVISVIQGPALDQEFWTLLELWTGQTLQVPRMRGADKRLFVHKPVN